MFWERFSNSGNHLWKEFAQSPLVFASSHYWLPVGCIVGETEHRDEVSKAEYPRVGEQYEERVGWNK